jgi:predicted RNA-binding protein
MRVVIEDLVDRLQTIKQDLISKYFKQNRVPPVVYHYTDINGLKGIIDSKNIWATHSSFLNDGKEIKYGDELMSEYISERMQLSDINPFIVKLYQELLGLKYDGPPSIAKAWDDDIYIASFSENGNLLDQWRAYAANGYGYSIGIIPKKLKYKITTGSISTNHPEEIGLIKVCYSKREQHEIFSKIVRELELNLMQAQNDPSEEIDEDSIRVLARVLSSILRDLPRFFKHPAFSNEQEWRIVKSKFGRNLYPEVYNPISDLKFRSSQNLLVPYIEIPIISQDDNKIVPIKKVFVGPKHRDRLAEESLKMYLCSKGYSKAIAKAVEVSDIPYR